MTPRTLTALALLPFSLVVGACSKGPAFGSDNAIIVVLSPALDETLRQPLRDRFERTTFTTRAEAIFEVTFTTPEDIGEFRKWRRIVLVEPFDSAILLPEVVDVPDTGVVVETVSNKWALNQRVYVLGAPDHDATVALVEDQIGAIYDTIHERFVEHHVERMWASEPDSSLARQIEADLGFSIVLPRVYRPAQASAPPDTRTWFNLEPRRVVSLHWVDGEADRSAATVYASRAAWGVGIFPGDSISTFEETSVTEVDIGGVSATRLQGTWHNPEDVTAGLFITYGVVCGSRLVLLDTNLYAPERNKYPYVLQFEHIADTFRCAAGEP